MRSGVTYQDVALAAEALQQAGERPTIERVRAQLGSTGSNTTISKYLQSWREQVPSQTISADKPSTPNIVQAAVDSVWQQMRQQADAEIAAVQDEAKQQIDNAIANAEAAEVALVLSQQQLSEREQQLHALSAEHELLKLDIKQHQADSVLLQAKQQALETRFHEMQTAMNVQLTTITNLHTTEINRLESLQAKATHTQEQLLSNMKSQYEATRHEMMLQLDAAHTESDKLKQTISQNEKQLQDYKTKLQTVSEHAATITTHLQKQEAIFATLKQSIILPDDILSKVTSAMTVDTWFASIEHRINQLFDKQLKSLDATINSLQAPTQQESVNA